MSLYTKGAGRSITAEPRWSKAEKRSGSAASDHFRSNLKAWFQDQYYMAGSRPAVRERGSTPFFGPAFLAQQAQGVIIGGDAGQKVSLLGCMGSDPGLAPDDSLAAGREPGARGRQFPPQDRVMPGSLPDRLEQVPKERIIAPTDDSVFGGHDLELKGQAAAVFSDF